ETVYSTPTAVLVTDPNVNHAPTVIPQQAQIGLPDTTATENGTVNIFLPLVTTFTDDTTAAANLIYNATLGDGTPLANAGLTFATTPDGAGGITGGVITGTLPNGFHGTIDVLVSATDAGGLTVTDTFTINVVPPSNAPDVSPAGVIGAAPAAPPHSGVEFNRLDLEFVLDQIKMAEAGQPPVNPHLSFGLREVAGTDNSAVPGQSDFGSVDRIFPRMTDPLLQGADGGTSYAQTHGIVFDS